MDTAVAAEDPRYGGHCPGCRCWEIGLQATSRHDGGCRCLRCRPDLHVLSINAPHTVTYTTSNWVTLS